MRVSSKHTVALVALPVLLLLTQGAGAAPAMRLTRNVQATKEDVDPARTYSAPYLAVDPSNDLHIVGSFIDFRSGRCGLIRSLDGGQTWKRLDALPAPASFPFCESTMSGNGIYHAPIAFGRDGTLYYAVMGWDTQDGGGKLDTSVVLARSKNLGDSWDSSLVRNNRGKVDLDVENTRPDDRDRRRHQERFPRCRLRQLLPAQAERAGPQRGAQPTRRPGLDRRGAHVR